MRGRSTRKPIEIQSSFLSCEKDAEMIIQKLFVESGSYAEELKRLLLINAKDCLDNRTNQEYIKIIKETTVADLRDEKYIRLEPKLSFNEHEEVKNYIIITFDNFSPNPDNPHYRDCTVMIDIVCHTDYWDIGNYRLRPLKIAGYIDGILNESRLSGIGTFQFAGCSEIVLNQNLSGYCLVYQAIHGADDYVPEQEEDE
jgi:hypothetical protein